MKHFKLAYSDKAYSVLNPVTEREIVGINEDIREVVVTGIEMFRRLLDEAGW